MTQWRQVLVTLILIAFATVRPVVAQAKSPDLPPPSIGSDPQSWASRNGWHLRLGAPQRDTLSASPSAALLAARVALENDHWEIDSSGEAGSELTTQWKAIHNIFFHLFSGKAFGRCFVSLRPLSNDRMEITFQGGVATRRNIEGTPMRSAAERAYVDATRVWQLEVRDLVESLWSGRGGRGGER